MFIRKRYCNHQNYYSLVENQRDENGLPQQRQIEWLGTYDEAIEKIQASSTISPDRKGRYLFKLASLEGQKLASGLPYKTYQCIVCDPPWESIAFLDIFELPIPIISDVTGCVLWLWFENAHFIHAAKCIEKWGYAVKGQLTWLEQTCIIATIGKPTINLASVPATIEGKKYRDRKPKAFYELVENLQADASKLLIYRQRKGWDNW